MSSDRTIGELRILQVISGISGLSSGTRYFMVNLLDSLENLGLPTTLMTLEDFQHKTYGVLPNYWHCPAMLSLLKREMPSVDIVHCNGLWMSANLYPYWVVRSLRRKSARAPKIVTSPHGSLSQWALAHGRLKKSIVGRLWQYPALAQTDLFHATSEKEHEEIRNAGYRQPVAIIPIGVAVPDIDSFHKNKGQYRRLVFIGRLHPVKGVDILINAWRLIAGEFQDWELAVVGPDGGALPELKKMISAYNIPRIRFGGQILGVEKYRFLAEADVCVLPSHTENFGVVVSEALSCGTPVIVSRNAPWEGLEGYGDRPRTGWWIENSIDSWIATMRLVMSQSSSRLKEMGRIGREWMEREYSWRVVGDKMKMAYEWLAQNADRPDFIMED